MRAFGVELVHEGVETVLLLQKVGARRARCLLLEREVHPFMPAILLRMAGLDAFDADAQPEPPDRQPRKVEEAVGGGEGTPLSERMALGSPRSANSRRALRRPEVGHQCVRQLLNLLNVQSGPGKQRTGDCPPEYAPYFP